MNLTLSINQEQTDALQARVDLFNAGSGQPPLSPEQFLTQEVVMAEIDRLTKQAFDAAVAHLGDAALSLPYTDRLALIAQVKSQLA